MALNVCPTASGVQAKILSITPNPTSAKRGVYPCSSLHFLFLAAR